jgi:hypothetical protein
MVRPQQQVLEVLDRITKGPVEEDRFATHDSADGSPTGRTFTITGLSPTSEHPVRTTAHDGRDAGQPSWWRADYVSRFMQQSRVETPPNLETRKEWRLTTKDAEFLQECGISVEAEDME